MKYLWVILILLIVPSTLLGYGNAQTPLFDKDDSEIGFNFSIMQFKLNSAVELNWTSYSLFYATNIDRFQLKLSAGLVEYSVGYDSMLNFAVSWRYNIYSHMSGDNEGIFNFYLSSSLIFIYDIDYLYKFLDFKADMGAEIVANNFGMYLSWRIREKIISEPSYFLDYRDLFGISIGIQYNIENTISLKLGVFLIREETFSFSTSFVWGKLEKKEILEPQKVQQFEDIQIKPKEKKLEPAQVFPKKPEFKQEITSQKRAFVLAGKKDISIERVESEFSKILEKAKKDIPYFFRDRGGLR